MPADDLADTPEQAGVDRARADAFRALHRGPAPLLLPNAWDLATAAALAADGHAAIGTTSLGVAAVAGKPDATGALREETLALARSLARLDVLVSVDVESGGSDDPEEVADFARELAAVGAVGVNLEDGRPDATLSDPERHAAKVAAVRAAVPGLFVNARTDPYWLQVDGPDGCLRQALDRGHRYAAAGADGVFVPGVGDLDHIAALAAGVPVPLNVLYQPGGADLAQLGAAGAARVSCGSLLLRAALRAVTATADAVRRGDSPDLTGLPTYAEVDALHHLSS